MTKEEGNIVTNVRSEKKSLLERYGIPIEHLSYEYISTCDNFKELERIVLILRSGEEGHYPDLTKRAEEHLATIKPASRILRKAQAVIKRDMLNSNERERIDSDIYNWVHEMHRREKDLEEGKATLINDAFPQPDIRRVKEPTIKKKACDNAQNRSNVKRISSCDYAAWDKYDVDTEINRIELRCEQEKVKAKELQRQREAQRTKTIEKETMISNRTELEVMASQEREKGNEAFRANDYEEALRYYNSSISMNPTPVAYNNRAMTYIKMQRYEDAVNDCGKVLSTDCTNVKALLRRAFCLECLEKNSQALADYEAVLKLEPTNKLAITGINKLRKPDESKKIRMKIEEGNVDDRSEVPGQEIVPVQMEQIQSAHINSTNKGLNITPDVCFCNRAPGSSKDTTPMPHSKADYCVDALKTRKVFYKNSSNIGIASNGNIGKSETYHHKIDNKNFQGIRMPTTQNERTLTASTNNLSSKVIIEELPTELNASENGNLGYNRYNNGKVNRSEDIKNVENNDIDSHLKSERQGRDRRLQRDNHAFVSNQKKGGSINNNVKINKRIDVAPKYEKQNRSSQKILTNDFQNIKTPYEFLCTWQSLQNDFDLTQHAQLLRSLPPEDFHTIIGNKLDGPMFSIILRCLQQHFCVPTQVNLLNRILKCISGLSRFGIINMFIDSTDKEALRYIFSFLKEQQSVELTSLRQAYKM